MKKVIIATPFETPPREPYSEVETLRQNIAYARRAFLDALKRGEAPLSFELLFGQFVCSTESEEARTVRAEWLRVADELVVYDDLGLTANMRKLVAAAGGVAVPCSFRRVFERGVDVGAKLQQHCVDPFDGVFVAWPLLPT